MVRIGEENCVLESKLIIVISRLTHLSWHPFNGT